LWWAKELLEKHLSSSVIVMIRLLLIARYIQKRNRESLLEYTSDVHPEGFREKSLLLFSLSEVEEGVEFGECSLFLLGDSWSRFCHEDAKHRKHSSPVEHSTFFILVKERDAGRFVLSWYKTRRQGSGTNGWYKVEQGQEKGWVRRLVQKQTKSPDVHGKI
jgi:hypothetical protein